MRRYGISLKGVMNSMMRSGLGCGGILDLRVRFEIISSPRIRNAQILMVQPNPTLSTRRCTMIGIMTPPKLEPLAAMPSANARFLKNHEATQVTEG